MAPDARVNGPNNRVATGEQILERFRNGELDNNHYERKIEEAYVSGDLVVLMGEETVVAQGTNQTHVGEKVRRRFTSVWRKKQRSMAADRATGDEHQLQVLKRGVHQQWKSIEGNAHGLLRVVSLRAFSVLPRSRRHRRTRRASKSLSSERGRRRQGLID